MHSSFKLSTGDWLVNLGISTGRNSIDYFIFIPLFYWLLFRTGYTKFGGVIGRPFRSLDDDSIFKCVSQRPLVFIPSGMSWKVKEKKRKNGD